MIEEGTGLKRRPLPDLPPVSVDIVRIAVIVTDGLRFRSWRIRVTDVLLAGAEKLRHPAKFVVIK
jgi:hypothetical protein